MKVPFARVSVTDSDVQGVAETLRSGWLTTGPRTKEFERSFAEYVGSKFAVAVNSCTAALHLALAGLDVEAGDIVLTPTLTFAATAEVSRYVGAIPVLVDCDPVTLCICPDEAAETIRAIQKGRAPRGLSSAPTGRIRVILPMHYGGQSAEMQPLLELADECGATVIEDAAHCLPADYRQSADAPWQRVGTIGHAGAFSFYANKCITTGEGGMLVTDDEQLANRARRLSLHGLSKGAWKRFDDGGNWRYEILEAGFKYNLSDPAAALGIGQLGRADQLLAERTRLANRYDESLGGHDDLQLPKQLPNRRHAWHLYAVRLRLEAWRIDRATFIREMAKRGVSCSVHYIPLHVHPYYREHFGYEAGAFPVADQAWMELVSLPLFAGMADAELDYVVATIQEIRDKYGA
jgi:dTDP-4-amino-4,6-dideoxygalactose transaminase